MMREDGENVDSNHILHLIGEGTVGAEVGVWRGSSSVKFVEKNLAHLHLIDPWSMTGYDAAKEANDSTYDEQFFLDKYSKVVGSNDTGAFENYYTRVYNEVVEMFKDHSEVTVNRMTFAEWREKHPLIELDWVYVDGDHSYTGISLDLELARTVVKDGGLIIGDDYKPNYDIKHKDDPSQQHNKDKWGCVPAINDFRDKYGLELSKYGKQQYAFVNRK